MKNTTFFTLLALLFGACNNAPENNQDKTGPIAINYPQTKKGDTITNYFGMDVKDPYRWLEDDRSAETGTWVREQNKVTFEYLDQIPFREALKERLTSLWNYEKEKAPFKEGEYTYFYKNDGLQNQDVVYRYKTGDNPDSVQVFLNPNTFTEDGTISLGALSFSEDGKIVAYSISEGGSDWRKVLVMNAETIEIIEDTLVDIKFSGLSWMANDGFYYSSYEKPKGSELSAKTDQHRVFYHKLGTQQSEDELIFGGSQEEKHRYISAHVTEDNRYLLISAAVSTSGNKLYIKDLTKDDSPYVTILDHTNSDSRIIENIGSKLYIATNLDAPNKKIVTVDALNPTPEYWVDFISETEHVLSISTAGGNFFAKYMVDAISRVVQYDYKGNKIRDVVLPGIGSASGFGAKKEEKELYYSFTNYITPGSIYKYNIAEGSSELYNKPQIDSCKYSQCSCKIQPFSFYRLPLYLSLSFYYNILRPAYNCLGLRKSTQCCLKNQPFPVYRLFLHRSLSFYHNTPGPFHNCLGFRKSTQCCCNRQPSRL